MCYVVDAVQVGVAFLVIHVLSLSAHDLDGVCLEEQLAGGTGKVTQRSNIIALVTKQKVLHIIMSEFIPRNGSYIISFSTGTVI